MTVLRKIENTSCGCDCDQHSAALIGIDTALRRISDHVRPIDDVDTIPLLQARGRILSAPVVSTSLTPPFDNSAMDGYAVDSTAFIGDGPWTLQVASRIAAGQGASGQIGANRTARIFTGAPIPTGADAVVMQEKVQKTENCISIRRRPVRGDNIRRAGEDMGIGDVILVAGQKLGPREIAASAAAGCAELQVRRKIRIALLVTGDEVQDPGAKRGQAGIWDINTPMLCSTMMLPMVDLVHAWHGQDSRAALERQLSDLLSSADLVVTTGGISVGEEDHVKPAMQALGAEMLFGGVAIKPGKPVSFGRIGPAYWLGLPGNPLSAFVTWQLFGTALIRALSGWQTPMVSRRNVMTAKQIRRKPGRCELRPVRIEGFDSHGREIVTFQDATHSGRVSNLPEADGLVLLPADVDLLPAGSMIEFQPFCEQ